MGLLVADETGLPALLAILESLPAGARAIALAEVADEDERQPVATRGRRRPALDLARAAGPPGTTTVLIDALRELRLPPERGQVWGGGEALAMRDVRRHLVAEHPAGRRLDAACMGYWKHRGTPDDVDD